MKVCFLPFERLIIFLPNLRKEALLSSTFLLMVRKGDKIEEINI